MRAFPRRPHLRGEEAFTLVELLIAMIVLTIGILALVAAYTSGYAALTRATRVSSATLLADSRMERYRALQYSNIWLNTSLEDSTYQADTTAYNAADEVGGCTATTGVSCIPTLTATGPDGRSYRIDTYIDCETLASSAPFTATLTSPTACASGGSSVAKLVTIVVRKSSGGDWVREQSTFSYVPTS